MLSLQQNKNIPKVFPEKAFRNKNSARLNKIAHSDETEESVWQITQLRIFLMIKKPKRGKCEGQKAAQRKRAMLVCGGMNKIEFEVETQKVHDTISLRKMRPDKKRSAHNNYEFDFDFERNTEMPKQ